MKFSLMLLAASLLLTASAFAQTHFPDKDGDFSAMLMIIPEHELAEFKKPPSEGPQLHPLDKVKRHEKFAIKLGFMGIAQGEDGISDVAFDVQMLGPDGTTIIEEKNLPALKGKVPNRFFVFNSQADIVVVFEDSDKAGTYKITAEIRDNVGKKRVPLTQLIELVD